MQRLFNRQALLPLQVIIICGIGAIIGLFAVWVPAYFLALGLGAIVYIVVVWSWPEFALLGLLLLLATVFDENSLPSVSIGIGHLLVSDFLLFIPIVILLLRVAVEPGFSFNHTPLDTPLLAFYGVAMFATISAIIHGTVTFNQSLGEVRVVNLYLTFFVVTNLIRDDKHLRRLLNGILALSIFVALMMIVQYFIGDIAQILPGRVETLLTGNTSAPGVTRILPPGQSLVLVSFITLPILLIFERKSSRFITWFFLMLIIGFAVLVTFNRSFWVALVIALFLAILLVSTPQKIRFINIGIWSAVIAIISIVLVFSFVGDQARAFVDGVATRFDTLLTFGTINEGSLQYRVVETGYAIPQILSHPFIGLGLGAYYRSWDSRLDYGLTDFAYIHDGHLWTILKTGLIGYLFYISFLFIFLKRCLQYWRTIPDPFQKAIVLSFAITIIGVLPATIVNPIFEDSYWTPLIGIMMGTCEVIFRLNREQNTVSLESAT